MPPSSRELDGGPPPAKLMRWQRRWNGPRVRPAGAEPAWDPRPVPHAQPAWPPEPTSQPQPAPKPEPPAIVRERSREVGVVAQHHGEPLVFPNAKRLRDYRDDPNDRCLVLRRTSPSPPQSPLRYLVILHGAEAGRRYALRDSTLTIGRSASNAIRIDDDSVSRTHATLTVDAAGVRIRDNGSKNGILVNDVALRECTLEYGDVIHIGRTIFAFASLEPGTTDLEALSQLARLRLANGFFDVDPVPTDTDAETEAMELSPSASPSEA